MSIDLLNKELNPLFLHMDSNDFDRPYPLSYYYIGSICQRLFDLPIYRLAFLYDIVISYCDSMSIEVERELSELLSDYVSPPCEVMEKAD